MTIQATIDLWFEKAKEHYIDLYFAGRVFGGRPGESPQKVTAFQLIGSVLVVRFDSTERLTITDPNGVELVAGDSLIVATASDARFGWHYYGKPQLPENWCEWIYRTRNLTVEVVRVGPLMPGTEQFPYEGTAFVELRRDWA